MVPLMQLISIEIAEKVSIKINIRTILSWQPDDAMEIIDKGRQVLDIWLKSYKDARNVIERSGTEHR